MNEQVQSHRSSTKSIWEPEKVDLKFLFDHMRNYGIAGSVLAMSILVSARGTEYVTVLPAHVVSGLFGAIGLLLMGLNLLQGIYVLKLALGAGGKRRWLALFWTALLVAAIEFTLEAMMRANWAAWLT